jgi:Zn-dependent protease with chaperone function/Zn-finger nucleic acid-binding protein
MERPFAKSFYQVREEQRAKTRSLFLVLFLFYVAATGALFCAVDITVGLAFARPRLLSPSYLAGLLGLAALFALGIAAFQLYDARRNGAAFILKRLGARPPDLRDRYHRLMTDVIEEMGIAAGMPKVRRFVIPDHAINSLALVEADGTPCVAMTEGLLAEFTRDEVQAAAAHELAHIACGDAVFLTFVCSLADFFERLTDGLRSRADDRGPEVLPASVVFMRLLGRFIGREREVLADAAAVELSRNPVALARAIYKAHLKNSFIGDFSLTYAPLFIVSPALKSEAGDPVDPVVSDNPVVADNPVGAAGRGGWADSHPPVMKRVRLLAEMANVAPEEVIRQVWESRTRRKTAKTIEKGLDETPRPATFRKPRVSAEDWEGRCPRCGVPLADDFYEGVPVRLCRPCAGKLVDQEAIGRILDRSEVGFSPALIKKARAFRESFLRNPIKTQKIADLGAPHPRCPECGYGMVIRPYNYQYFVPVEKCLSCFKTWFDADELEILQILVEDAKQAPPA